MTLELKTGRDMKHYMMMLTNRYNIFFMLNHYQSPCTYLLMYTPFNVHTFKSPCTYQINDDYFVFMLILSLVN